MKEIRDRVLAFWFGEPGTPEYGKPRQVWFRKSPVFDERVRVFLPIHEQAAAREYDAWQQNPEGALALILLLDQFPRHLFRGQPRMFATDERAIALADRAVRLGMDRELLPVQRWFIYLPFEHSEDLERQHQAVELFSTLEDDPDSASCIDYAYRHLRVIQRFGRFPHRNAILQRPSTPEELEFLAQPGSSF